MLSHELAKALLLSRNNDVAVEIPCDSGSTIHENVTGVRYDGRLDKVIIDTELAIDQEEQDVLLAAYAWRKNRFLIAGECTAEELALGEAVDALAEMGGYPDAEA